jgi:hypothetical protein
MYPGNKKADFAYPSIRKIKQFLPDFFQVEKGIFITNISLFYLNPCHGLYFVILIHVAGIQDLVNRFTSMTAKGFVVPHYRMFSAIFAAMDAFQSHGLVLKGIND